MAMQVPVVASIQQAPNGFVQHWVMPVMQLSPWDAHTYYQANQAVEFGDRVWMGTPKAHATAAKKAHAAKWQRGGYPAADSQLSYPPSDGESTKAPSSPRSGPGSGHVPTDSDGSAFSPTPHSSGPPVHRQPSAPEHDQSLGHRPNAPANGLSADVESHVSVVLGNLPKMLCSTKCLEVAIEQACHENDVVTFEMSMTRGVGEAVVILRTETAAQRCIRHFTGLRCGRSSPIVARYNAEAGRQLMARRNGAQSVRDEQRPQEPEASTVAPTLCNNTRKISASKHQSAPELFTLARRSTEGKVAATSCPPEPTLCDEIAKAAKPTTYKAVARTSGASSPTPSVIDSPTKSKKLWADYDDDADDEDGFCWDWDNQSTLAPPESEASAAWNSDTEAL